jgi:PAS domain S-box-containing protein
LNAEKLRILHLEDDPYDAELAHEMLEIGGISCDVMRVDTEREFVTELNRTRYDLIMADNAMPTFDGLTALVLAREIAPQIPFIFVSGSLGEEVAIESLKSGATDYVLKQSLARLVPVVKRALQETVERKQRQGAELALRRSEERFRALIENSADAIALIDSNGAILYESPSVIRILGFTPEDMVGRNARDFVHPQDGEAHAALIERALGNPGVPVTGQFRYRHKDSIWRWVESSVTNLLDQSAVESIVVNFRDITRRKEAEDSLRQRVAEMEAVTKISAALRIADSRTEMPAIILKEVLTMMNADGVAFLLRDPNTGETLVDTATAGFTIKDDHPLGPQAGVIAQVIRTGEPYLDNEFRMDPDFLWLDRSNNVDAVACVPLKRGDLVIGALWIGRSETITQHDLKVLAAISDLTANAIHRTTLHERTLLQLQRLAALRDIDRVITSSLDLHQTLDFLLGRVQSQLAVDAAAVLMLMEGTNRLEYMAGRGFTGSQITRSSMNLGEGYSGKAAAEQRLVVISDMNWARPPFRRREMIAEEKFVNFYSVPLIAKNKVRGVLEAYTRSAFKPTPEWLDFLQTIANQAAIAIDNAELYDGLQRSNTELREAYDTTIEGWSRALDLRDRETEGHTQRVAELTVRLARIQGLDDAEIDHIRRGALLHDIGKMGVPDQILHKPAKLTEQEWVVMRMHPVFAYELLSPISYLRPALDIPYCHHEKWDGSGYPRGLSGGEIPLAARLFAVVDVWDALRSDRPYRDAWSEERALNHIRSEVGTHFDPQAVDVFLQVLNGRNGSGY